MFCDRASYSYKILSLCIDSPSCVQGALQLSVLKSLVARVRSFPEELRIIPELTLNCTAFITNIFIGAAYFQPTTSSETIDPQLVIWNCTDRCERLHSTNITREALAEVTSFSSSLYKTDVNFELRLTEARESFIIGIEQPSNTGVQIYYQQEDGLANYLRAYSKDVTTIDLNDSSFTRSQALPLIHPVLGELICLDSNSFCYKMFVISFTESVDGNNTCNDTFINFDTLRETSFLIQPIFTPSVSIGTRESRQVATGYQYFFINSPFQSSGEISTIIFAAERTQIENNEMLYPVFQIWRCNRSSIFDRVFSTDSSAPLPHQNAFNLYEYHMQFQYQVGDVLGLYQPVLEHSKLIVAYQMLDNVITTPTFSNFRIPSQAENSFETYNYLSSNRSGHEDLNYTPLITVTTVKDKPDNNDILQRCIGQFPPTETMSTNTPRSEVTSSSTRNTESLSSTDVIGTNNGSSLSIVTIAGSAVGAVIGILVVMVLAVAIFLLALKCKRRKEKKFVMPDSLNPVHSAAEGIIHMELWPIMCTCCHNRKPIFVQLL